MRDAAMAIAQRCAIAAADTGSSSESTPEARRLAGALLLSSVLAIAPGAVDAEPVRIVALGDSITQADATTLSYRYNLWIKLVDEGIEFDLVGSGMDNSGGNPLWPDYQGQMFDQDHEGHWGWRADAILAALPGWLANYSADIALIHIGTNDVLQQESVTDTADEIALIIDALRTDNPQIAILLAQLIPCDRLECSGESGIEALNAEIAGVAAVLDLPESPVVVVDQFLGFDVVADTYDGVHPNASGEEKLAQNWMNAIIFLPEPGKNVLLTFGCALLSILHAGWRRMSVKDEHGIQRATARLPAASRRARRGNPRQRPRGPGRAAPMTPMRCPRGFITLGGN